MEKKEVLDSDLILKATSKHSTIYNFISSAAASFPFFASVASYVGNNITKRKFKRFEKLIFEIGKSLEEFKEQVDEEFMKSEQFDSIFENVFKGAINDFKEEKLEVFRNVFLNSAIKKDIPIEEKDFFLELLNNLSAVHIKYLFLMQNPEKFLTEQEINPRVVASSGFAGVIEKSFPNLSLDHLKVVHSDLFQMGLLNTDSSIYGTLTAASGVDIIKGRISPFGDKFISFCSKPELQVNK